MKLKFAAALVAGTAAITMLAGCPTGVPGTNPPAEEFKFAADSLLTGKILFDGKALSFADAAYKPVMKVKEPGQSSLAITADIEEGQYFQFKNLTDGKAYQAVWDYTGTAASKASDVNTVDVYVSDPATASAAATDPMISMDIEWEVGMTPDYAADVTVGDAATASFTFSKIQNLNAEYQVTVYGSDKSAKWSSAWLTTPSVTWNGKLGVNTNTPDGAAMAKGAAFYNIKFRKVGGTYNGTNFYGETQFIPVTIK